MIKSTCPECGAETYRRYTWIGGEGDVLIISCRKCDWGDRVAATLKEDSNA